MAVNERFDGGISDYWRITAIGAGRVEPGADGLRLIMPSVGADAYSDAQISDYSDADFVWRPPLRLTVRAWARAGVGGIGGTAGFGFWNQPFMPGVIRPRLPRAVWFFYSSPPSDMRLAHRVPGPGWKAATIDATRLPFLLLAPTAPVGVLLMRIPALYDALWPIGQRALGVSEALLDPHLLAAPHTYTLDWLRGEAVFAVDGAVVHRAPCAPRGPLGFVAWVDNQYAVITPQGRFGFGLVDSGEAALMLESVTIEPLAVAR